MNALIQAQGLELAYGRAHKPIPAAGPVDFDIREGESFGLIGESGAGKSTLTLEIMGLLHLRGGFRKGGALQSRLLPEHIAYIPQDALSSLDPLFSIGSQMAELGRPRAEIHEALRRAHLPLERISLKSYPHELSGGMRQRLLIAMALLRRPRLIVADEPTSSLDLILQSEIIRLFDEIRKAGMTFLLVTHDLPLAAHFCDRVAIMRHGKIVETGNPREIFRNPRHEYTRMLVGAVPRMKTY